MDMENLYANYLNALLEGNRSGCTQIVQKLLNDKIDIKILYTEFFQKSLYRVGELWESNRITVAREHLATSITESLLNLVYPALFEKNSIEKKVVMSCAVNEYHQVGGKIVADMFELNGWNSYFLGANTPIDHLLSFIDEEKPDLACLSISIYFNMPSLKTALDRIKSSFPDLDLLVGGQAFRWGGSDIIKSFKNTELIFSLDSLDELIKL